MFSLEWVLGAIAILCVGLALQQSPRGISRFQRLLRLPADERGAVQSLSFVLTLPIFVMLLLFIIQLTQLTVARVMVEYAAYAAARSAIVWIPAEMGDDFETPNRLGFRQNLGLVRDENDQLFDRYNLVGPSRKMQRIKQAAAHALLPICPSRDVGVGLNDPGLAALPAMQRAYQIWDPRSVANARIPGRLRNKLAYGLGATTVEIEVRHKATEPPLIWHDIGPYREEFEANEMGWQDQVLVTVRHDFALLPGPARLLAKRAIRPGQATDPVAEQISRRAAVFVYPLSATVRLSNEGEKSVAPFVYH